MDIYLVRNLENRRYLYMECDAMIKWVEQEEAQVYNRVHAYEQKRMFTHDGVGVEVVHFIAIRPGIDPLPVTGDKEPIKLNQYYYLPVKHFVFRLVYAAEIVYQRSGRRSRVFVKTGEGDLIETCDLYKTGATCATARHYKPASWWEDEKDKS